MTRAELRSLAERVEKATGADRALDLDVWRAVCPDAATAETRGKMPLPWLWCVTSSLDAAVSLADHWVIAAWGDMVADGLPGAVLLLSTDPVKHATGIGHGTRESGCLARALTAAALRAMAEEAGDE
jgi:hypothetical protein